MRNLTVQEEISDHIKPVFAGDKVSGFELSNALIRFLRESVFEEDVEIKGELSLSGGTSTLNMTDGVSINTANVPGSLYVDADLLSIDAVTGSRSTASLALFGNSDDAVIIYFNGPSRKFSIGTDANDSDTLKIDYAAAVGGATKFSLTSSGVAKFSNSVVFTTETATAIGSGATGAIDWNTSQKQKVTITGTGITCNFTNPSGPCNLVLKVVQGDGNDVIGTWDGDIKWPGGTAPTLSTGNGDIDILSFYFDGTNYFGVASLDFS